MMAKTTNAMFDIEQVTMNTPMDVLIKRGRDNAIQTDPAKLAQMIPVARDPWKRIQKVENKLIKGLIPMRHEKMGADIFSFYRGTAELMAGDLKQQVNTNIPVVACGDAHLGNFGFYASPERQLIFDLNDFDEAHIGHWENDLRRLLVSVKLAGSLNDFAGEQLDHLVKKAVKSYCKGIDYAMSLSTLDRFNFSSEIGNLAENLMGFHDSDDMIEAITKQATKRTSSQVIKKYTTTDTTGELHFVEDAPQTVHIDEKTYAQLVAGYEEYRRTVADDVALLLTQYHLTDIARHSVGVGSFGTRCYLLLLTANDGSHLVLQIKEALPVRDAFIPEAADLELHRELSEGQRIIAAQKILQTASDAFIGYFNAGKRSYYVRQFRDMKASVKLNELSWKWYKKYVKTTSFLLAVAHSQSPTAPMIKGYLDNCDGLPEALANWTMQYDEQVKTDYQRFLSQVADR
ncbi:hypothetical protein FC96_GL002082 [Secundilactobacillus kimchicus JCM 15530]|uniref:DUF2252 domain-containing protein n=2 Tax=Secundilactobacillus kimchicus TaxID=528209 RepID=A0A0R1HM81_9LACO|nr:hypothetical protein FC96_GL002082 [Secundilactobacillus kimchicus JCM 15530]